MATSCLIGNVFGADNDLSCEVIYCHFDGGLDYVGKLLCKYYTTEHLVSELMKLGDLSSLGRKPESDIEYWDYKHNNTGEYCKAYRDRGDRDVDARKYPNPKTAILEEGQGYNYFFLDGKWWCKKLGTDPWLIDVESGEKFKL